MDGRTHAASKSDLEQKIAQMFIENLEGNVSFRSYETVGAMTGTKDDTPLIAGGYIFFSFNKLASPPPQAPAPIIAIFMLITKMIIPYKKKK